MRLLNCTHFRQACQTLFGFALFGFGVLHGSAGAWASPAPLPNGGFEQADAGSPAHAAAWSGYGQGYQIDTHLHHSGAQSLRCQNPASGQTSGAFVSYAIHQSRALPILVTGWSKAQSVDGVTDNDYSIYVDLTYTDGSSQWGQTAPFETGSHDWQRGRLMLFPSKPVQSMNVYALLRNHTGTAWFDNFDVHEVMSNALFDSQNLAPPVLRRGTQSSWFVRDVAAGTP